MRDNYYLSVFKTKNQAVFLYSTLETMGYKVFQLVSTPCIIKAGCNYSIKFSDRRYVQIILNIAKDLEIEVPDIYFAEKINGKYKYIKILI